MALGLLGGIALGSLGLSAINSIFDIWNTSKNNDYNSLNFNLMQENFDYQKALQERIFEREDTAVQRRMEDLKAAGINPNFAAGSSANSGSVVSTTPAQRQQNNSLQLGSYLDVLNHISQLKLANEQTELLSLQKMEQKNKNLIIQNQKDMSDLDLDNAYINNAYNNAQYSYDFGFKPQPMYKDYTELPQDYYSITPFGLRQNLNLQNSLLNQELLVQQGYTNQINANSKYINNQVVITENQQKELENQLKQKDIESYDFYKNLKSNEVKLKYLSTLVLAGRLFLK